MRKLGHDEGYAKGYQAALDAVVSLINDKSDIRCSWLLYEIRELKEKADDR